MPRTRAIRERAAGSWQFSSALAGGAAAHYPTIRNGGLNSGACGSLVGRTLPETFVQGDDDATSWSTSLSYKFLEGGVVPYVTVAESSATLAAANNTIAGTTILAPGGLIGSAEITEASVKNSLLDERVFITLAHYEQTRTAISSPDDPTAGADIT